MGFKAKQMSVNTLIVMAIVGVSSNTQANVESDMADMFGSMGANTSFSSPGAYKSQASSLYTAGGFNARFGNKNFSPMNIQMPSVSAGCGGIDFFAGAFSFANKEQFLEFTRNLGNNAAGVAFDIALDALDPLVGGAIGKIRDLVNKMNQFGMGSCQAAQMAVGGLAGELGESLQKSCEKTSIETGQNSDGAEAAWYCKSAPRLIKQRNDIKQRYGWDGTAAGMLSAKFNKASIAMTGGNLTLMAAQNYNLDAEQKRWLLSIIGTMTSPKPPKNDSNEDPIPKSKLYSPTITSASDILSYFSTDSAYEGKVKIKLLKCSDPDGGSGSSDNPFNAINCTPEDVMYKSFKTMVKENLAVLKTNIDSGGRADATNQSQIIQIVNNSSLPLLKMALMDSASGSNLTEKAIDVISLDLARQYLTNLSKAAKEVLGSYQSQDKSEQAVIELGYKNLDLAINTIRQEYSEALQKASNELAFADYLKKFDSHFKSSAPNISSSISFSRFLSAR
jgi:conjugative transfer pilus assembly protein TraH